MREMIRDRRLVRHVKRFTKPHYLMNDSGHGLVHRDITTKRGLRFVDQATEPVDRRSVYVGAMYHDVGHHIDQDKHEEISAQMCEDDKKLQQFFSKNEIIEIAQGIADHRASNPNDPPNMIGKIITTADYRTNLTNFLEGSYVYRRRNNSGMELPEIIDDAWEYTRKKFGKQGYALSKMYFHDPEIIDFLQQARDLTSSKEVFTFFFLQVISDYHKKHDARDILI